jgi:hypothetical protein
LFQLIATGSCTGGKFTAMQCSVIDTGGAPWLTNIEIFEKFEITLIYFKWLGGRWEKFEAKNIVTQSFSGDQWQRVWVTRDQ